MPRADSRCLVTRHVQHHIITSRVKSVIFSKMQRQIKSFTLTLTQMHSAVQSPLTKLSRTVGDRLQYFTHQYDLCFINIILQLGHRITRRRILQDIWTIIITSSPCALTVSWQDSCINKMTYNPRKLGQNDLVFLFVTRVHQQVCACRP